MTITLDYQINVTTTTELPSAEQMQHWVSAAVSAASTELDAAELTIRIVDRDEGLQLNKAYRGRDYATNVLSFPFDAPVQLPIPLLGDLVICADVVAEEAQQQHKALLDHWTHMVIHGTLHLLGYDHIQDDEAEQMEQLERDILASLNIADPYQVSTNTEQNA
ncbi:rRNA maturation RNase YbeY [Idiomarina sp. OT37-5b]|uniref:Endoribonuclease YbeY n=1 Tax=Idiomarina aquatica TaxID=1327752 RepID=A0AA94EG79_9GAMM|nr:rRNA maturation RNase YbeY [Idiomarina sp. OT37-5b]RUO44814.1 rRNA maturation RNase YbeY [Idiomarina aquatica]